MMRWPHLLLAASVAACATFGTAQADPYRDGHWYHGSIHHFHDHDFIAWRGGRWYHGYYGGRTGWFWMVGGVYYWYPAPIYPYPDPFTPPEMLAPAVVAPGAPPPVAQATPLPQPAPIYPQAAPAYPQPAPVVPQAAPVYPQAAPAAPQTAAPGSPQMWYYCGASRNYYPYVASCPSGWQPVPATPGGTP